jgi:hypothetical protein
MPGWRTIHSPVAVVSKRSAVRALRLRRVSWSAAAQIIRGKGIENQEADHDDTAHGGQKNEDLRPIGTGHDVPPLWVSKGPERIIHRLLTRARAVRAAT